MMAVNLNARFLAVPSRGLPHGEPFTPDCEKTKEPEGETKRKAKGGSSFGLCEATGRRDLREKPCGTDDAQRTGHEFGRDNQRIGEPVKFPARR